MCVRKYQTIPILFLLLSSALYATIFGKIQGVVHDPQHRPIAGATVEVRAAASDWMQTAQSDASGEFSFSAVPVGDYRITVAHANFETVQQNVTVEAGSSPVLHFQLAIGTLSQTTVVVGDAETAPMDSVTPTTLVDRQDIAQTPGADRTNSMAMITDYVPGSYVTHDMLHMRGGHQVDWLIDGVPIPNTNIATNLGPQIDPKDIDYLEVQRGSYDADYGDRTYGIFNIVPRSGFESNNEGELVTSFGNWYQTNDQLKLGSHTKRFAYYVSVNGNRSNYGLQPPIGQVVHDAENGYGGFASFCSTPIPATNSGWSPQCVRIITRFPSTPILTPPEIRSIPVTAFATVSGNPTVTWPSPGSTRLTGTYCSRFRPSIITTRPVTIPRPTIIR